MAEPKHFEIIQEDGVTVLRLVDPKLFETIVITELHDELLEFVETRQPRRLVVDFEPVSHCSTAVINSVLRVKKRLLSAGGQLRLCSMSKNVRDAYRILNLDGTVFAIHDTRDEALTAFGSS